MSLLRPAHLPLRAAPGWFLPALVTGTGGAVAAALSDGSLHLPGYAAAALLAGLHAAALMFLGRLSTQVLWMAAVACPTALFLPTCWTAPGGAIAHLSIPFFFGVPAILAPPRMRATGGEREVALISAAWLGALALVTMLLAGASTDPEGWGTPCLVGDGRIPLLASCSALAMGAVLALGSAFSPAEPRRPLLGRAGLAPALFVVEAVAAAALARSWVAHREPLGGVTAVVPRAGYTCALRAEGEVLCWGVGDRGQLGDGALHHRYSPVHVRGLHDVTLLRPPCALLRTGEVRCWGVAAPFLDGALPVPGLPAMRLLDTAGDSVCGVTLADDVLCWSHPGEPHRVMSAPGALDLTVQLAGACLRFPDRAVCFKLGSRGLTTLPPCFAPPGSSPPRPGTLRGGGQVLHEITTEGRHRRWARHGNDDGCATPTEDGEGLLVYDIGSTLQGDGRVVDGFDPAKPPLLERAVDLRSGGGSSCAVRDDGSVWCWGANHWGELGDGTREPRRRPVRVLW